MYTSFTVFYLKIVMVTFSFLCQLLLSRNMVGDGAEQVHASDNTVGKYFVIFFLYSFFFLLLNKL